MSGLIVHEWIAKAGGSEKVVDDLVAAFPDADLQVLWSDVKERYPVKTFQTWLARTPLRRHKALALPFMPAVWRSLRSARQYDWLLVSSHLFAHHARLPRQRHLAKYVYAHTPARYIWVPELDVRGASPLVRIASALLQPLDRKRAHEATRIAANSEFTRRRIQRAWGLDPDVIYPPVDVERIIGVADWRENLSGSEREILDALPSGFLLGASRMIPYKRLDAVIEAGEATNRPVVIAGSGPLWQELSERARRSSTRVELVDRPSDALLFALYQRAHAFIFPAVEDFGIMPVEAMAAGTPVVVPSVGGAAESVRLAQGGVSIEQFEPAEWRRAMTLIEKIDRVELPRRTLQFASGRFQHEIREWLLGRSVPDGPQRHAEVAQ